MKVAIHQPNYFPWLGYFIKMAVCDIFVFHDNVQIVKDGPTRRVKISANHSLDLTQWLTVPLKKHSDFALIKDLEICWDIDWTKKHVARIFESYKSCGHFEVNYKMIREWYDESREFYSLRDLNIHFISKIVELLNIHCEFRFSSQLPVSGKSTTYNLNIVEYLQGSNYICGKGSDVYQDDHLFLSNQISIERIDALKEITSSPYIKTSASDSFGLSIIDGLMNVGIEGLQNYFNNVEG